eukprot:scaffold449_cov241-Pinguiococcus_pyrenoidosus.AAC.14
MSSRGVGRGGSWSCAMASQGLVDDATNRGANPNPGHASLARLGGRRNGKETAPPRGSAQTPHGAAACP